MKSQEKVIGQIRSQVSRLENEITRLDQRKKEIKKQISGYRKALRTIEKTLDSSRRKEGGS